jgi:hypothetical protein
MTRTIFNTTVVQAIFALPGRATEGQDAHVTDESAGPLSLAITFAPKHPLLSSVSK